MTVDVLTQTSVFPNVNSDNALLTTQSASITSGGTVSGLVDPLQTNLTLGGSSSDGASAYSGNTLLTATNLGSLNGRWADTGSVSSGDRFDYFEFTTTATTNLTMRLTGAGSGDADIYLIYDQNGNGVLENTDIIARSETNGSLESLNFNGLAAGTYHALVYHFSGNTVSYNLTLTSDTAGSNLSTARNLGNLVGSTTLRDYVGNDDPNDVYRFNLNTTSNLSLGLTGLSEDAELFLIRDINQNGVLDASDILERSINSGNASEFISVSGLAAGSYFIQVAQYEGNTNYTLNVSAAPSDPGSTLSTATNLGLLNGQRAVSDSVSINDPIDTYRFSTNAIADLQLTLTGLSSDADLYLIQDSNNNGLIDSGDIIQASLEAGSKSESITFNGLAAGNYFVRVEQYVGSTDYTLTLNTDSAGEKVATARNVGTLVDSKTVNDFVGTNDPVDYYRFNVTTAGNLALRLEGLTADADLYLMRDFNNNGVLESNEVIAISATDGTSAETINFLGLASGTYYVRVNQYNGNTNYKLNMAWNTASLEPGDSLSTAVNLGTLAGRRAFTDGLNASDLDDLYRVSLQTTSDLQVTLSGLSSDADLYLVRDFNNNGVIDSGEILQTSTLSGIASETLNLNNLAAGNYFIGVRGYGGNTNYNLTLTSDAAGESLATARNIGVLTNPRSFTDFISPQDTTDFYQFTLNTTSNVSIGIPELSADFDLYLIQDLNGNGLVDTGETIAISATDGISPESITINNLASGTYYVRVQYFSGQSNYTLNLSRTPAANLSSVNVDLPSVNINLPNLMDADAETI